MDVYTYQLRDIGSMVGQRRIRRSNINPILVQFVVSFE